MKLKLLVLFLGILLFNISNPVSALDEKKVVRVALSNQSFSVFEFKNTKITASDKIKIIDMAKNQSISEIDANKTVEIKLENSMFEISVEGKKIASGLLGPLLISSNSDIGLVGLNRKGTPAKYKGMIELRKTKSNQAFNIVNVIDMKNYLRGVVPNEMPVSFGLEALKAQAVAARNYAQNAQMNPNYDLVDSTAAQVYYGANSYAAMADDAVDKTQGIYALYNSKPIMALYFSTSSGITDNWDDVFATSQNKGLHPYLKSKADFATIEPVKTEEDAVEFFSSKKKGLDTNSPKFRWSVEFSASELENILNTTLKEQSKTGNIEPLFDGSKPIEGLKEIKPVRRLQSGKLTEVEIVAKTGKYKVKKELVIRRVFKKNGAMLASSNFFVDALEESKSVIDNSKTEKIVLKKDDKSPAVKFFDKITLQTYPKTFKFIGGGFGHGVGMSQFGAYNLAKSGKKYCDILSHYYSDIVLSTLPKTVGFSEYNLSHKTDFYFDNTVFKKVYLIVENQKGVTKPSFKINELDFSDTDAISKNKLSKIDITKYLKQGINFIDFSSLSQENKGRNIIYRVEFEKND